MAVKIYDTMTTASDGFPLAYAEKINVKRQDGSEDNLQNLFNNGELSGGGGGSTATTLTQEEYDALDPQEQLEGEFYCYNSGRHFRNGVEYGKDGVQISDVVSEDSTWSSKKINDSLVDLDEKKADADKVVNFEYIRDNSSEDAKELIQKHWSEHENFKFYNLHLDTAKWAWDAEIYFHTSEYGTVLLRSYGNDASNIWYGKVYAGVWTWQELATITTVDGKVDKDKVAHIKRFYSVPENDWNNAIEEGYYSIQNDEDANAIGNKPYKYALQIRVIRADTNDVNYAYQIAYVSSEDTSIYIRRQKRDGTWLPWGKVCITTVADVGVTTITPVNSNITGNIEYTVKNGICYVSMKNLMSTISSTNLLISTTMPKPSINCTASSVAAGGNIAMIYIDKNTTNLRGNFYTKNAKSDCSFSYPVAEN